MTPPDFATIFQASLDMRYHFFVYYHEIHQLLATQSLQIYELINLNEQRRTFVLSESSKIIELMTKLKVRYYVIQQLTFEQLELVTQNIEALIKLHPHIDYSLEPLLKLSPSISRLIYSHIDSFIILLKSEEMDYQQLINLNIEQLELLLLNPEQDNIQLILRPSISCSIL